MCTPGRLGRVLRSRLGHRLPQQQPGPVVVHARRPGFRSSSQGSPSPDPPQRPRHVHLVVIEADQTGKGRPRVAGRHGGGGHRPRRVFRAVLSPTATTPGGWPIRSTWCARATAVRTRCGAGCRRRCRAIGGASGIPVPQQQAVASGHERLNESGHQRMLLPCGWAILPKRCWGVAGQ